MIVEFVITGYHLPNLTENHVYYIILILPTALLAGATKAEAAATRREKRKKVRMVISGRSSVKFVLWFEGAQGGKHFVCGIASKNIDH